MNVREWRLQFGTVGDNDVFVPVERLFADAAVAAVAVVIAIHIDHAVALGHLVGGIGYQIDAAPAGK